MTTTISIPHIRGLVRRDGSRLVEQATDERIDKFVRQDAGRPAMTPSFLAGSAIVDIEFDVLCARLRDAMADGGVLDYEPADDKAMRAFRRAMPPRFDDPLGMRAQDVAGRQFFLARRLFTAAGEIVDDAGADVDAAGRALAVGCVLVQLGAWQCAIPKRVADAMPVDEWRELRASRIYAQTLAQPQIAAEKPLA